MGSKKSKWKWVLLLMTSGGASYFIIGLLLIITIFSAAILGSKGAWDSDAVPDDNSGLSGQGADSTELFGNVAVDTNGLPEWLKIHIKAYNASGQKVPIQIGIGIHFRESSGSVVTNATCNDWNCCGPMQMMESSWNSKWKMDGNGDGVMDIGNAYDSIFSAYHIVIPEKYNAGLQYSKEAENREVDWIFAAIGYLGYGGLNDPFNDGSYSNAPYYKKWAKALDYYKAEKGTLVSPIVTKEESEFQTNATAMSERYIQDFGPAMEKAGIGTEEVRKIKALRKSGSNGSVGYGLTAWSFGVSMVEKYKVFGVKPSANSSGAYLNPNYKGKVGDAEIDALPFDYRHLNPNIILPASWTTPLPASRKVFVAAALQMDGGRYCQLFSAKAGSGTTRLCKPPSKGISHKLPTNKFTRVNPVANHSDCSNLITYAAYQISGKYIGGTTVGMRAMANAGKYLIPIQKKDLRMGDIIYTRAGHVVIFLEFSGDKITYFNASTPAKGILVATAKPASNWVYYTLDIFED